MFHALRRHCYLPWFLLLAGLLIAASAVAVDWQPGDPVGAGGPGVPEGAPYFADNFDSYALGSDMDGQGGWKGWNNLPGAGALVSDAQSSSAPHSVDIQRGSDLVHEFTGFTSGVQTVSTMQYFPSTSLGTSYFIVLNDYDDACASCNWSVQVQFSVAAGALDDGSGASLPLITDRWVELRVEIDLDADTQTFYYDGQVLYTGAWAGYISGGGLTEIAAVDLFANGANAVFYDDVAVGNAPAIPVQAIPTLGGWGFAALILLLTAGSILMLRRRRATIA